MTFLRGPKRSWNDSMDEITGLKRCLATPAMPLADSAFESLTFPFFESFQLWVSRPWSSTRRACRCHVSVIKRFIAARISRLEVALCLGCLLIVLEESTHLPNCCSSHLMCVNLASVGRLRDIPSYSGARSMQTQQDTKNCLRKQDKNDVTSLPIFLLKMLPSSKKITLFEGCSAGALRVAQSSSTPAWRSFQRWIGRSFENTCLVDPSNRAATLALRLAISASRSLQFNIAQLIRLNHGSRPLALKFLIAGLFATGKRVTEKVEEYLSLMCL